MSLQVDFLLKPFEAYNRMYFRPRLLKQHFHFFAADSLSIMLPQTVYRWAVMNGFISKGIFRKNKKKEKKEKIEESELKLRKEIKRCGCTYG